MYTHTGLLGKGATSFVYEAVDKKNGEKVAIKCMYCQDLTQLVVLPPFHHPHLVCTRDVFFHQNTLWLVTEVADKGSIARVLQQKRFTEQEAVTLLHGVVSGLAYLHAHGGCHGDLKTDNLLMDADGRVKLCDFSIRGSRLDGTLHWMAPERLREGGDAATQAADVWSVGIVAYELLTGYPPGWEMETDALLTLYPAVGVLPFLVEVDNASPVYRDFVQTCLHPKAARRPSAEALLNHEVFRSLSAHR